MWEYGVVRAELKAICMQTWALYTKNSHSSFAYNTSVPSKPYQLWPPPVSGPFKTLSTLAKPARPSLQNPINSGSFSSVFSLQNPINSGRPSSRRSLQNPINSGECVRECAFKTLSTLANSQEEDPSKPYQLWLLNVTCPSKPYQLWPDNSLRAFKTLSTLACCWSFVPSKPYQLWRKAYLRYPSKPYQLWQRVDSAAFKTLSTLACLHCFFPSKPYQLWLSIR